MGGKSFLSSCWLVSSCIRFENIRAVIARLTLKSLRESTWNTILMVMKDWGLEEDVHFKINNVAGTITFWNDSVIIAKELASTLQDPNFERLGSSEFTIAAIDEVSQVSEMAVNVLRSRLRWKTHDTFKVGKLLLTTNPCVTWVRDRFVMDENGDKVNCRKYEFYVPFRVTDNPDERFRNLYKAQLEQIPDAATRARLLEGEWRFVDSNDLAAYWNFVGGTHLENNLKERVYDPLKPLVLSFDFNVNPYMSCLMMQFDYDNKKIYVLEELLGKPKDKGNNTPAFSRMIKDRLLSGKHKGGIIITGDPAGKARTTQTEEGTNNYTILTDNLKSNVLRPKVLLFNKQPSQLRRLEFVNEMFKGYDGWEVAIDMRCRKLTEDFIYQKKNPDGTKEKKKVNDPDNPGSKFEKYGHLSDCFDYAICYFAKEPWGHFQSSKQTVETTTISEVYSNFSY